MLVNSQLSVFLAAPALPGCPAKPAQGLSCVEGVPATAQPLSLCLPMLLTSFCRPVTQGVAGWVHEGLLAAAAYVLSNTVDALAEAADRCPGWPLVVAGKRRPLPWGLCAEMHARV